MRIKITIYGLLFGSMVFAAGCPKDNNDPQTNNQPNVDMSTDQSGDMTQDMPDMDDDDMSQTQATACTWLRTQPATLPLEEAPQDITVVFGCDGVVRDDIILKRAGGDLKADSVTCRAGEAGEPAQWCDVFIKGVTPSAADAAGPETLTVTLPGLEAIDTTLRWHYTVAQLEEQAKATQTYKAPKSLGSKGLGFHLKALDKDNATFFGVHAHKVLIEKDLEKQRQEILKNLEFEFGTVTNTSTVPAAPTAQTIDFGTGQLMYQQSAMARTATGFEALWWGQVNDGNNAYFVGALFNLDAKGQPTGPGLKLNPQPQIDPLKTMISSQLYHFKEIGIDTMSGYAAGTLHTTKSGKWQLTAMFTGDNRRGIQQSKVLDTFGGILAKDVEEGRAWAGLLPRPIQFDPKDATYLPIGWNAQPSAQGIAFSIVDATSTVGEREDTVQFVTTFEVKNVYVGVTDKFTITVLLAGDNQQAIYTIKTDGNKIQPPTALELPLMSDYTPPSTAPSASVLRLSDDDRTDTWLETIEDDNGTIILKGRPPRRVHRRLRIRRRIRKRIGGSASYSTFWNGSGTHIQTTTSVPSDKRPEFGVGKVSDISGNNTNEWVSEDTCLTKEDNQYCGETDHFRPIVVSPNGTAVGLIDGKTVTLGVQSGDGTNPPEVLTLPNMSKQDPVPPVTALLEEEEMAMMPYKAPGSVNTLVADAVAIWFIDKQGKPSQPALVNFGADIEHATLHIAGMGTEVLVFFRSADGQTGNVSAIPVADLKALIKDTKTISPYDLSKNAIALGTLAPDGPDVELLTNNALMTPFGRTTKTSTTTTDFISASDFIIAHTGEGCGKPSVFALDAQNANESNWPPFTIASDDYCPDVNGIVGRGDFLGTGSEQLLWLDGKTLSLIHTSTKEFQIPEKVVMEKDTDFYGLSVPPTTVINTVNTADYNGDGLLDVAIDTSDGVFIAFSDGNGSTLSTSGAVPGLSRIVNTFGPPLYKFGKGTKKASSSTAAARPQLQ